MNETLSGLGATEDHARLLYDSFLRWTGKALIQASPNASLKDQLFQSSTVILSHGTEPDPVLNYGNQAALSLWEMPWETFTGTPSRLTAEPMERQERARFFENVTRDGYVDNYTGIRISLSGRRFYIMQATVWNLIDEQNQYRGQAATFSDFRYC
ncbi:MEKHLA domain-containing protein [Paenibacillus cremeus]|uniref:MEKHLA domain-containing protein n=1 Tax=Paenibacillus cremeus TaxID=2163881 RepID=A0A559KI28_9BACL|nr:MEKHLA domain-containing protein [Paenibacillus cremeus]TVY11776.1 MEKHLA domain-containing protein [Paenibacillus cremeus]